MIVAGATGFATGFALILAIGAQNALVLRQGLLRQHVLPLVLLCAVSDAILITAGVAGFGAIVERVPWFPSAMLWAGAAFLIAYGGLRFWAAARGDYSAEMSGGGATLAMTLATGAAFTWLNPHVYLDTLALMGAISTQFTGGAQWVFALGGVAASFSFFFGLGFGARLLAPLFQSGAAWRKLDVLIGVVMWALAIKLILSA